MIRIFVAIALPEKVLKKLEEIIGELRQLSLEGRFLDSRSIHLTLKFLGNVEEEQIPHINGALEKSAQGIAPFDLKIQRINVVPHLRNPRVVWMGVNGSEALGELRERIERRFEEIGFPRETREFKPHLTLLRIKGGKNLEKLVNYIETQGVIQREIVVVGADEVHLYQSILKPSGAEYRKRARVELSGGDREVSCSVIGV